MNKFRNQEPVFNLTRSFSQLIGKTVRAAYLSVRHPFTFTPYNIGSIMKDIGTGAKQGWQSYDKVVEITVDAQRMEDDVATTRTAPNPS